MISQYGDRTYEPATECMQQLSNFLHNFYLGPITKSKSEVFRVVFDVDSDKKCPPITQECFGEPYQLSLGGPPASSFLEWLWRMLDNHKIPYRNFKTDGDYYRFRIGDKEKMEMDWKHLDEGEVEVINMKLEPFGYYISHDGSSDQFVEKVQWCKLP